MLDGQCEVTNTKHGHSSTHMALPIPPEGGPYRGPERQSDSRLLRKANLNGVADDYDNVDPSGKQTFEFDRAAFEVSDWTPIGRRQPRAPKADGKQSDTDRKIISSPDFREGEGSFWAHF